MKWLLITTGPRTPATLYSNVGDEFAMLGVRRVIMEVDPLATFDVLDKEDTEAWAPREFDKAVLCGMPLFWSLPGQDCQEVWWWSRIMRDWPTADRGKFMVLGAGHVFVDRIRSMLEYTAAIQEVINRAWRVTVREPIMDHPQLFDTLCPSTFTMLGRNDPQVYRLCNLMPDGGHFGYLHPEVAAQWNAEGAAQMSTLLMAEGFTFVAHTLTEAAFADSIGWPAERVLLFHTAQEYLDLYASASAFIGNRQHAAVVCAAAGCPVLAFTHDSRMGMVARVGGRTARMADVTPDMVKGWLADLPHSGFVPTPYNVEREYANTCGLVREFMAR